MHKISEHNKYSDRFFFHDNLVFHMQPMSFVLYEYCNNNNNNNFIYYRNHSDGLVSLYLLIYFLHISLYVYICIIYILYLSLSLYIYIYIFWTFKYWSIFLFLLNKLHWLHMIYSFNHDLYIYIYITYMLNA